MVVDQVRDLATDILHHSCPGVLDDFHQRSIEVDLFIEVFFDEICDLYDFRCGGCLLFICFSLTLVAACL